MPNITAVLIDSREPDWIKGLKFLGIPTTVTYLESGDILAVTDDGHSLIVERKTPDDFLNSLKDGRLLPQIARMMSSRYAQQATGVQITNWPYLVITEPFKCDVSGKIITERGVTGWNYSAAMGALLSIQEMGCGVIFATNPGDYMDCILRLGKRERTPEVILKPPRMASIIGPKANFLSGLPGIGFERVQDLLDWYENNLARIFAGITDLNAPAPIGHKTRQHIRELLGLAANEKLVIEKENNNATQEGARN